MIQKNKYAFVLLGIMAIPGSYAQAQDYKPYLGFGLGVVGLEETAPGFSQKSNVFGGFAKVGADFNDYIGGELRVGTSMKGSKGYPAGALGTAVPTTVDLKSDYFVSYLAKLQLPVTSDLHLYVLAGGTTAKFKTTVSTATTSTATKAVKIGASYGAGVDYSFGDQSSVGAEWMQYWTNVTIAPNTKAKLWSAVLTLTQHF